jgi:hypothetical protein
MAAEWGAKDGAEGTGPEVIALLNIVSGTVTVTRSARYQICYRVIMLRRADGCAAVRRGRGPHLLPAVVGLCQLTLSRSAAGDWRQRTKRAGRPSMEE